MAWDNFLKNRDAFWLQRALNRFNTDKPNWFKFKTKDDSGNVILPKDRNQYKYIEVTKSGATIPSEADVNAKIQEIKNIETAEANARTSGINKLKGATYSALTDAEAKALFGE
jgi:hypothetical protein